MKTAKICKRLLAVILCLSFLTASALPAPVPAKAAVDNGRYVMDDWDNPDFANRCFKSMTSFGKAKTGLKIKATAYLAGTNDIVKPSWYQGYEVCDLYAVDPYAEIQGKKVDPKWLPQDNDCYLLTIATYHLKNNPEMTNKIYTAPRGWQGTLREGCKLYVVDYDEEWVTVWEDGFQIWSVSTGAHNATSLACTAGIDAYLETHPAGFYRIRRKDVWMDFNLIENHPYKDGDTIPEAGEGVVTKLVYLRAVPDETEKVYTPVYALPRGTKLNVVSTNLVPSKADGSTRKFYRVSFNGSDKVQNNAVYYLKYSTPGVYYIDSRYLNFTEKGKKPPAGDDPGEITNIKSGGSVYAYQSKDTNSDRLAVLTKGTEIPMYLSESDEDWTTVYFSGQKCYVQTKYIKIGTYDVTNIGKPYLADIVKDQYVVEWSPGKNNIDFYVELSIGTEKRKDKQVLWSADHYEKTTLTIDRKYLVNERDLHVIVQANTINGNKGKARELVLYSFSNPGIVTRLKHSSYTNSGKKIITVGRDKIEYNTLYGAYSIQYSTDKKFKNAKIVENPVKKNGKVTNYKNVKAIKNLKPDTTYYIRYRTKKKLRTSKGDKWISGPWSKTYKITTKK